MDYAHRETERGLKELEERIRAEYTRATETAAERFERDLEKFNAKDAKQRELVKAGKLSKKDYEQWRTSWIADNHWNQTRDTLAQDLTKVAEKAQSMTRSFSYDAYALNRNYGLYECDRQGGVSASGSFQLYDRRTVQRLFEDNDKLYHEAGRKTEERIRNGEIARWNKRQIQSEMTQGILLGESVQKIARRLPQDIADKNMHAAIRNARTITTGVENAARIDSYKDAEKMGIGVEQMWVATFDGRTRHTHAVLDGVKVAVGEKFPNGCEYPGDPNGEPEEIYNCRCRVIAVVEGSSIEKGADLHNATNGDGESYEEWYSRHQRALNGEVGKEPSPKAQAASEAPRASNNYFKDIPGMPEKTAQEMDGVLTGFEGDLIRSVFGKHSQDLRVLDSNYQKTAHYNRWDGGIRFNAAKDAVGNSYEKPYGVVFHELGHNLDYILGDGTSYISSTMTDARGRGLKAVMRADFQDFKKQMGCSNIRDTVAKLKAENNPKIATGDVSDMIEGITGISYPLGIGHGAGYHKWPGKTETEFFAEVCSAMATNPESLAQIQRIFPAAYDMVLDVLIGE